MAKAKKSKFKSTSQEYIMKHATQWFKSHPTPDGTIDVDGLTDHFIKHNLIDDPRSTKYERIKSVISRAMSRHRIHDPELGMVRPIYPVKKTNDDGQGEWEWAQGEATPADRAAESLRQRYNGVEARIQHIEADRRYYNKTNKYGAEIPPMNYDFKTLYEEKLLADKHGGEYPDEKPD